MAGGCGKPQYDMPYVVNPQVSAFRIVDIQEEARTAQPFATDLCVASSDVNAGDVELSEGSGAVLFDLNRKRVLYANNLHERLYPASLTKIMTALCGRLNTALRRPFSQRPPMSRIWNQAQRPAALRKVTR